MKLKPCTLLLILFFLLPASVNGETIQALSYEENGFVGHDYPQSHNSTKQPVVVLGGSEGGLPTRLAEVIAQNGFPTLAVAYFKEDSLPQELEKIQLEYFDKVKSWLNNKHPESANYTLVGWSKGSELALILASKDTMFNRVVAIAPSSVVWAGILSDWQKVPGSSWTFKQEALSYVPFNPTQEVNGLLDLYSQSLASRADNDEASIKAEKISGSVFLYSGGKDDIWPSSSMGEAICKRMEQNQTSTCKHYVYPSLGHLLDYEMLDNGETHNQAFIRSIDDS